MNELDVLWRDYSRLQAQVNRCRRADAKAWGLEAGLDHLLALQVHSRQSSASAIGAVERGKSRERYRARLRGWYFNPDQVEDPTSRLDDRARLHSLMAHVEGDDRTILLAIGSGHDSATVANMVSKQPNTVRQRIDRLRSRLAAYQE